MLAAETDHREDEALAQARKAVERIDALFDLGGLSRAQVETASEYLYQIAVTHKNFHRLEEGIRHGRRCVEISRSLPGGDLRVGVGLSLLADLYRVTGDLDRALVTIAEARAHLQRAVFPNDTARRFSWITLLWREGKILGAANGLGLNRTDDAIVVLQEALALIEEWTRSDPQDARSRLFFVSLGRELGELLRIRDPERALALYDHCLRRLGSVLDNAEARRGEAVLLAGSAYALRRLGRNDDAGSRLDAAFRLLAKAGEYPAPRTSRNTAVESLLRARGDHLDGAGQPQRAVESYEELLGRLEGSKLDSRHDLRDAVALSETYLALAALYRRVARTKEADVLTARRVALWREWESRLPKSFIARRQLDLVAAR
jgi:tetratricopeptide (TPR) repeat protein